MVSNNPFSIARIENCVIYRTAMLSIPQARLKRPHIDTAETMTGRHYMRT